MTCTIRWHEIEWCSPGHILLMRFARQMWCSIHVTINVVQYPEIHHGLLDTRIHFFETLLQFVSGLEKDVQFVSANSIVCIGNCKNSNFLKHHATNIRNHYIRTQNKVDL